MKAVFDTNILIDFLLGVSKAKIELSKYNSKIISLITWMEIMVGADLKSKDQTENFLSSFIVSPISIETAKLAVNIRKINKIKLPDAIVLATAEENGCILVTRNTKDFLSGDPRIRVPYRVR